MKSWSVNVLPLWCKPCKQYTQDWKSLYSMESFVLLSGFHLHMLRFSECPTECDTTPTHILKTDDDFISFLLLLFFLVLAPLPSSSHSYLSTFFSGTVPEVPNPGKHM